VHVTKRDSQQPFVCSGAQIGEAQTYHKAFSELLHTADAGTLSPENRKALSAFSFGSNGVILPPEMSNRIISCLVDPTDVTQRREASPHPLNTNREIGLARKASPILRNHFNM